MKLKAAFLAIALATTSATSAGSATITPAQIPTTKRVVDLTECQVQHLARCYVIWGDYGWCYQQAQDYAC
ncbi:hypothetical protein [Brevundimonas sp. GCM10030266]|uniref:hypothetical protein n=1 Tax=Brevundimonas sp. GCM10030266 TaxID=3273386 RepID=UPI00361D461E